jgi:ASC-1-like (ASCH) protein
MILTKYVQDPWFSLIQNGNKIVEGRLNKGNFKELKKGFNCYLEKW